MSADELVKAADKDILNVIKQIAARQPGRRDYSWKFGVERSGGVREQAEAFGTFAEKNPARAIKLLAGFTPQEHDKYAAAAMRGLGRSTLQTSQVFELVIDLDRRGFTSDDFRHDAAWSIEHRVTREVPAPKEIVTLLRSWLETVRMPEGTDQTEIEISEPQSDSVILSHGGLGVLTHGRGAIVRALAAMYVRRDPIDVDAVSELMISRAGKERNRAVVAEMLAYFTPAFADKPKATVAYDRLISSCPEALSKRMALHALATISGYVEPAARYEAWLSHLGGNQPAPFASQAYGELLFLYRARSGAVWADEQIALSLKSNRVQVIRGLAYGAARGWLHPHCRSIATDILCTATTLADEGVVRAIDQALVPSEDRFPVDHDAKRLIREIITRPQLLSRVASNLMESLAPAAGIEPSLVSEACRAVLDALALKLAAGGPVSDVAAPLTSAAITLHRQPAYREEGLSLFEELIRVGVHEAVAALELIDRRPTSSRFPLLPRRPRRRRRKKE